MRISDWSSDVCSSDLSLDQLLSPEAPGVMIIHHPCCLHPGINDCRPAVLETPPLQLLRDPFRQRRLSRQVSAVIHKRLLSDDRPARTEERRVGKACVSTGSSRWSQFP